MTRERWLQLAAIGITRAFEGAGLSLPTKAIRVACGWPTRRALVSASSKSRVLGQCFPPECSAAGHHQIFVSPVIADGGAAAAILAHELCHVIAGAKAGHGPAFKRVAVAIGLAGKMTETHAGPELAARLNAIVQEIGPYPHASLDAALAEKKQGTRMLKLTCPECGYTVRTTAKWIAEGLPTCHCGAEFEAAE